MVAATELAAEQPVERPWWSLRLRSGSKKKPPRKRFKLTKPEKLYMILLGVILSTKVARPIGSWWYFMFTQMFWRTGYVKDGKDQVFVSFYLKNVWDNLPLYIDKWLNKPIFAPLGTVEELKWWVAARHDLRGVGIGVIAILLANWVGVGVKEYKRASKLHMALAVPFAFIAAIAVAVLLIAGFAHFAPSVQDWGTSHNIPILDDLLKKGTLELFVVGLIAGVPAKMILARTFDTLQGRSLERNIAQGDNVHGWRRFFYTPAYVRRHDFMIANGEKGQLHNNLFGKILAVVFPFLIFSAICGTWLLTWGPAAHAG